MPLDTPQRDGFFATLGALAGSRQRENQLSRTFKACFDASTVFQTRVLDLLARTCAARVKGHADWGCVAEEGNNGGGRFDLVLRAPGQPTFVLESKVESVLTLSQLRRYRSQRQGRHHVVAVTKYRPEVPRRQLRRAGIHALRWQDIHRALTEPVVSGAVDRFITASFADYLVGEDMAYRSSLSSLSLRRAGRLLAASGSQKSTVAAVSAREGFGTLDALAQLLLDLTFDVRDEFPALAASRRFGPYYGRYDGQPELYAGREWGRTGHPTFRSLAWGFSVAKDRTLRFSVWIYTGTEDVPRESRRLRMAELTSRGHALDRDRVWQVLRRQLKQWGFKTAR